LWFEDFLQQLGYENNRNINLLVVPGKNIADGLMVIASDDDDTNLMVSVVER